ncbi:MAG TPA: 23S rRNA (pseudouridine(1915)-N(3))-methyltransferase RlmH, partial [Gammaproteobacteria bacterium]|nr:23S rRNA (pseudouridine(1915)-N(3))-methyltransferase RlmH [Gammaproteobacteria bacterium]
GGADGLAAELKARANMLLSLSSLTYPHYMVRIVLAEAIYRAWTIQIGHPYHRD